VGTSATGIESLNPRGPNQSFSSRSVQGTNRLVGFILQWSRSTDFPRGIFVDAVIYAWRIRRIWKTLSRVGRSLMNALRLAKLAEDKSFVNGAF
jgi:hypothetical protein